MLSLETSLRSTTPIGKFALLTLRLILLLTSYSKSYYAYLEVLVALRKDGVAIELTKSELNLLLDDDEGLEDTQEDIKEQAKDFGLKLDTQDRSQKTISRKVTISRGGSDAYTREELTNSTRILNSLATIT